MTDNELTRKVIGLAIEVHKGLGPGLLESVYKECLYFKIKQAGMKVEKEKSFPIVFEGLKLECGYKVDLFIENKLVIELKSVEAINPIHMAQTLTYLRLGEVRYGLLINFNVKLLKEGVVRLVNGY
jgi:GxxExxY protein